MGWWGDSVVGGRWRLGLEGEQFATSRRTCFAHANHMFATVLPPHPCLARRARQTLRAEVAQFADQSDSLASPARGLCEDGHCRARQQVQVRMQSVGGAGAALWRTLSVRWEWELTASEKGEPSCPAGTGLRRGGSGRRRCQARTGAAGVRGSGAEAAGTAVDDGVAGCCCCCCCC
ncbi:hypothetical protein DFJ73DRAFT_855584 [Zopfochytrium polystomum]|nr:hypothetical protein DFJ73DRAFT_855584 [Zopfochytrium polystomum]